MKILLYLQSLTIKSDAIGNACLARRCTSASDIVVDRFFVSSPHSTWDSDMFNGDRLSFSIDSDMKCKGRL
jgi:hypothetical protein